MQRTLAQRRPDARASPAVLRVSCAKLFGHVAAIELTNVLTFTPGMEARIGR